MPSKAQKQRGWLLPDQIGGHDTICVKFEIPDTPEYRAATVGMVYELSKWWNWQRTANREAVEASLIFGQLIHETLEFGECEPVFVQNGCRIGEIFAWVGEQAPAGCLPLDGRIVALADFPELGNVVPGEWVNPVGGVASIILPNLTARALVGADVEGAGGGAAWAAFPVGIARELGSHEHTLTIGEMPAHTHKPNIAGVGDRTLDWGTGTTDATNIIKVGESETQYDKRSTGSAGPGSSRFAETSSTGGGQPHINVQPSFTVMWCIVAECIPLEVPRGRPFVLRQNPEDPCLLEQSIDGGVSWTTAFNYALCDLFDNSADHVFLEQQVAIIIDLLSELIETFDGTPESIAPDAAQVDAETLNLAICAAVEMTIKYLIYTERDRRYKQRGQSLLYFLALAVVAVVALFTGGFGAMLLAYVLAQTTTVLGFALNELALSILEDDEAVDKIICCLTEELQTGQLPTLVSWESAIDDCGSALGGNAHTMMNAIIPILQDITVYVAFVNTIETIVNQPAQLSDYICPCQPEPEPEPGVYFDGMTTELGIWSHLSRNTIIGGYSGATAGGDWISTQGRNDLGSIRGTFHSASGWREASVVVDLQMQRTVTFASWWRKYPGGGATVDNRVVFYDSAGAVISDSLRSTSSSGNWIKDEFTGTVAGIRFVQFVSRINANVNVNIDDIRVDYS